MGKQRPPARLRGENGEIAKDGLFLLLWGSVCCYYAPPSAFHLWNSRTHHGKHHSPLSAGGIYSGAVHVRNPPPVLSGGQSLPAHEKRLHLRSDFTLWLLLLLAAVLLIRLISMGAYPLMDTTEARYAEMSRKMLETNQWLVPQFDYGIPFWGKPPLSFWASAVTMKLGGVNEWSARLAPFLASLAMGLLFFAWPFRSQSVQKAAACFLVLAASGIGFVASGAVMTDEFLALGIMLSMISFWKTVAQPSKQPWWKYLFFCRVGHRPDEQGTSCPRPYGIPNNTLDRMEPGMEKRLEQSPLDKRRLADAGAEPSLVSSGRKANSRLPSLLHCRRTLSALYRQRMAGRPVRLRTRFSPGNHLALRTDHVPALDPPAPPSCG